MLYPYLPHFCTIFKVLQSSEIHKFSLYVSPFLTDTSERILKISFLYSSQLTCISGSHSTGLSKQTTHRSLFFFPHLRFNLKKGTGVILVSLSWCPGVNLGPVPLLRYYVCPCSTPFLPSLTADGETLQFSIGTRNGNHLQLRPPSRQNFCFSLHNLCDPNFPTFNTSCLCLSYFLHFYLSTVPLFSKDVIIHHCKYLLLFFCHEKKADS